MKVNFVNDYEPVKKMALHFAEIFFKYFHGDSLLLLIADYCAY